MRASEFDIMPVDTFISYLDHRLTIDLITFDDSGAEVLLSRGNKNQVLDELGDLDKEYILCDTDCVYIEGNTCTIYVE